MKKNEKLISLSPEYIENALDEVKKEAENQMLNIIRKEELISKVRSNLNGK